MFIDLNRNTIDFDCPNLGPDLLSSDISKIYFPMGELHLRLDYLSGPISTGETYANVLHRIRNSEDILQLLLLSNILEKNGIEKETLYIPYLPYSRQDRIAIPGEPHSLQVIGNLLDELGFNRIVTVDVHSNVAEACFRKTQFENYKPFYEVEKWLETIADPRKVTLIAPDEGAMKRTSEYMKLGFADLVPCFKKRDPVSGKLTGFEVFGEIKTREALVIDDICDGGGTFNGLAPKLIEAGAQRLFLWVTHGGFTKGLDSLLENYNEIGCTNSYRPLFDEEKASHRVTQIPINYKSL